MLSALIADENTRSAMWIPTISDRGFAVLFRFYRPEKPMFDKTCKLADIEKPNETNYTRQDLGVET